MTEEKGVIEEGKKSNLPAQFLQTITSTSFVLLVIGVFVVVGIGLIIYHSIFGSPPFFGADGSINGNSSLLESLKDTEVARGLITFLVAITTVAIAIILSLYAVVSSGSDFKDRFMLGKEILRLLIGVLGTILGFYFGSAVDSKAKELPKHETANAQPFEIAQPYASNGLPKKSDTVKIVSFVSGGMPPYKYSITFYPAGMIDQITDKVSESGLISEDIKLSEAIQPKTEITYQIEVKDNSGKKAIFDKEKVKKIIVASE